MRRPSDHSWISVSDLGYPASGTAAPRACALALAMFGDVARPCAHWSRLERDRPGPVAVLQRPASDPDSAVASRSDGSLQAGARRPTQSGPSKLLSLPTKLRKPGCVNVTGKEHRSPLKFVNSCSTTSDSETTSAGTSSRTDESLTHHPQLPRIGSDFCMVFS
jgi:hypothetical protein